jgi:hypothetical protein
MVHRSFYLYYLRPWVDDLTTVARSVRESDIAVKSLEDHTPMRLAKMNREKHKPWWHVCVRIFV